MGNAIKFLALVLLLGAAIPTAQAGSWSGDQFTDRHPGEVYRSNAYRGSRSHYRARRAFVSGSHYRRRRAY